jgi:hypothetical protein
MAEEIVKKLDPLLARLAEIAEAEAGNQTQVITLLQQIAKQLGVPGIVVTIPAPPTPTPSPVTGFSILNVPLPVIPLPEGTVRAVADLNPTTATFQPVVSYTPTQGKTFNLAKIVASCNSAFEAQLYWKGKPISVIYKQVGGAVLTDWFPYGYTDINLAPMVGDGTSQIQIMGRYPTGGSGDDLWGEVVGEEV